MQTRPQPTPAKMNRQTARCRWGIAVCLATSLVAGCGRSEENKNRARADLVREIGLPPPQEPPAPPPPKGSETIPLVPKTSLNDTETPWTSAENLPIETWEIQYIGNQPVGFSHRSVDKSRTQDQGIFRLEAESRTQLRSKGKVIDQRVQVVTVERDNGELLRVEGSVQIDGNRRRFEGSVRDGNLQLNTNVDGLGSKLTFPWNPTDRGPFAIEQSLVRTPMNENEVRELRYFDPIQAKLIDVRLQSFDFFDTPTFDGSKRNLLEVEVRSSIGDSSTSSQVWVSREGHGYKSYLPALDLRSFRCDPRTARVAVDKSELADLVRLDVSILGPRPRLYEPGPVKYRVESRNLKTNLSFPSRTNQTAKTIQPRKSEVRVYPSSMLDTSIEGLELEGEPDPLTLSDSPLVQSSHPQIQRLAKLLLLADGLGPSDPSRIRASSLRRGIAERLPTIPFDREVNLGHQTLAAGQGDCFDHAVLLAATCRADSIPARIAVGLLLTQSAGRPVMTLHGWVEIHDGQRWIPIDSSQTEETIGADRIKWGEFAFENINPYDAILSLGRILADLEISILPSSP